MNRDTILRLAKQCGHWSGETVEMNDVGIERFAALIHDHLTYSTTHSCHPGCTKPACVAMREAVLAEREACAQVAEAFGKTLEVDVGDCFAEAIRSRT